MKKTKLDLYRSAADTAFKAIALTTAYEIGAHARTAFDAEKNDPADWDYWSETFERLRGTYVALRADPAPSVVAKPKK